MNIELRMSILEVNLERFKAVLLNSPDLDLNEPFAPYEGSLPAPYHHQILPVLSVESSYLTEVIMMIGLMQNRHVQRDCGVSAGTAREKLGNLLTMVSILLHKSATLFTSGSKPYEHLLMVKQGRATYLNHKQLLGLTRTFLENGHDGNSRLLFGDVLIHPFVIYGIWEKTTTDALKLFLQFGLDIESLAFFGMTPLMLALLGSDYHAVKFLLDQGANIYQTIYAGVSHHFNIDGPLFSREVKAWEFIDLDLYKSGITKTEDLKRPVLDRRKKSNIVSLQKLVLAELRLRDAGHEPLALFAELALRQQQMLLKGYVPNLKMLVKEVLGSPELGEALKCRFPEYRHEWRERLNHVSLGFHLQQQTELTDVTIATIKSYHGRFEPVPGLSEAKRGVYFQRIGGVKQLSKSPTITKLEHRFSRKKSPIDKRLSILFQPD